MRRTLTVIVMLTLTGCLPLSVNPLYTGDGDIVYDEALLGTWGSGEEGSKERWTFAPHVDDAQRYALAIDDGDGRIGRFNATLVQIGDRRFLDLEPVDAEPEAPMNGWYAAHLLALRSFMRVDLADGQLSLTPLDMEKLLDLLQDQPDLVGFEFVVTDGGEMTRVLFTADSAELQAFVHDHLDDATYFTDATPFVLLEAPATQPAETRPATQPVDTQEGRETLYD